MISSSVSSHTSASLWDRMAGAALLCRRRMGETITAGGLFSGSESVASGVVNEDTVVAGVVPRLAGIAACFGGIA
jgi:hypothetical protein